jgi:hypothetical protein
MMHMHINTIPYDDFNLGIVRMIGPSTFLSFNSAIPPVIFLLGDPRDLYLLAKRFWGVWGRHENWRNVIKRDFLICESYLGNVLPTVLTENPNARVQRFASLNKLLTKARQANKIKQIEAVRSTNPPKSDNTRRSHF